MKWSLMMLHSQIKEQVYWASPRNGGDVDRFRRAVRAYEDFLDRVRKAPDQFFAKVKYDYPKRLAMHQASGVCVVCLKHQARDGMVTCQPCHERSSANRRKRTAKRVNPAILQGGERVSVSTIIR